MSLELKEFLFQGGGFYLSGIQAGVHSDRVLGTPPDIRTLMAVSGQFLPCGIHSLGLRPLFGAAATEPGLGGFDLLSPRGGAVLCLQHSVLMVAN